MSAATDVPRSTITAPTSNGLTSSVGPSSSQPASDPPTPNYPAPAARPTRQVADAQVVLAADFLTDIEALRIATESRIRSLIDVEHGKGLPARLPTVVAQQGALVTVKATERGAVLALERAMRGHYLGAWQQATPGIGAKQLGRLLGAIGDPTWNTREGRPRRGPAELWAYCGLHVLHPGHDVGGAQSSRAGVESSSAGGQQIRGAQTQVAAGGTNRDASHQGRRDAQICDVGGVAPFRRRGQPSNWNEQARSRVMLLADSCIKCTGGERQITKGPQAGKVINAPRSPYRDVYERGREKYADALHTVTCLRCGPSGRPARPGSTLNDGHKHSRARRLVAKAILRDLWREAREQAP